MKFYHETGEEIISQDVIYLHTKNTIAKFAGGSIKHLPFIC